jgi:hypothetical protein
MIVIYRVLLLPYELKSLKWEVFQGRSVQKLRLIDHLILKYAYRVKAHRKLMMIFELMHTTIKLIGLLKNSVNYYCN